MKPNRRQKRERWGWPSGPSPPPPLFSVLTTVQLSRGYNSYFANHNCKIKNTPSKNRQLRRPGHPPTIATPARGQAKFFCISLQNVANYLYKEQKVGSAWRQTMTRLDETRLARWAKVDSPGGKVTLLHQSTEFFPYKRGISLKIKSICFRLVWREFHQSALAQLRTPDCDFLRKRFL